MRQVGRIVEWNDDKGYGFVLPHDGGRRAFVHVKAFQRALRRPAANDLISYEAMPDAQGRLAARDVRFAGQRIAPQHTQGKQVTQGKLPRTRIAVGFFMLLVAGTLMGLLPWIVVPWYGLASALSHIAYRQDKAKATTGQRHRRTFEDSLHVSDLLGGWPGGLVAQQQFRHKTVKSSFQIVFWTTVVANLLAMAWLVESGLAAKLGAIVAGT